MNPETRKKIYTTVAGAVPILITLGYLTTGEGKAILDFVAAAITLAATLLARANVKP